MPVRLGQFAAEHGELTTPSIPSIYAAHLVQLVARWGITPEALVAGIDLDPAQLEQAQTRVSPLALRLLIERAIELTGEPGLGFYYGLQLKLSSHGSVGFAAMTSATLRDALSVAERFVALRAPVLALRIVSEERRAAIELSTLPVAHGLRVFLTEALVTALVQMARTVLGRNVEASFEIAYPEPSYASRFLHLWPGEVRFGREATRIWLPLSLLDESLQMADPVAARQALTECERDLTQLMEGGSLLTSVRRQLAARERGFPSLTELARERHVSPRTMKRRLAEHGTSYQKLLDELRRDRALALLLLPTHTIERIAEQLGYSDPANFNRAFRRWLGVSPSSYREQQAASPKDAPERALTDQSSGK